ncbi:MAG: protein translocase subunit SecF [Nitrospinota bacterium]
MEIFPPGTRFDFIGKWRVFVGISCAAVLLSLVLLAAKGLNYGIDFTGGALVQVLFREAKPISEVREAMGRLTLGEVVIQNIGHDREFLIRVGKADEAVEAERQITRGLEVRFGKGVFEIRRAEMVGPQVGHDLRRKALFSVLLGWLAMLIYVGFRFRFIQGVAAIVALVHDVIITLGVYALSGKEFNLPTVAAILTIIGYSINDTIVIFDRIRENVRLAGRLGYAELINTSINQTLSRTILTTAVTMLSVLAVLFLGGELIADVAFALVVGMIAGTYSTVYVAGPILLLWHSTVGARPARNKKRAAARP